MLREIFSNKKGIAKHIVAYSRMDHIQRALIIAIRLFLVGAMVWMLATNRVGSAFLVVVLLITTYVPHLFFERGYGVKLPVEFHFVSVIFLFSCIFLGTISRVYSYWPWWDKAMHLASGIVFGFLGFLILYTLYEQNRLKASLKIMALLAFCFSLASGAIWEMSEYFSDNFLGSNAQHTNEDTMNDIVFDMLGALIVSVAGYRYLKNGKGYLHRFINNFRHYNPHLFGQKPKHETK
jgi:hypothetical protein